MDPLVKQIIQVIDAHGPKGLRATINELDTLAEKRSAAQVNSTRGDVNMREITTGFLKELHDEIRRLNESRLKLTREVSEIDEQISRCMDAIDYHCQNLLLYQQPRF